MEHVGEKVWMKVSSVFRLPKTQRRMKREKKYAHPAIYSRFIKDPGKEQSYYCLANFWIKTAWLPAENSVFNIANYRQAESTADSFSWEIMKLYSKS